jgi:hypothetical protein
LPCNSLEAETSVAVYETGSGAETSLKVASGSETNHSVSTTLAGGGKGYTITFTLLTGLDSGVPHVHALLVLKRATLKPKPEFQRLKLVVRNRNFFAVAEQES